MEEMAVSRLMQFIGRHYVRYFNFKYERTGTLWDGRFHASLIQGNAYLLNCQRYIELNPVRAGIVEDPADYDWSSYKANGLGVKSTMLTPHPLYLQLGKTEAERLANYRALFQSRLETEILNDIRYALDKGLVLGTERFKLAIEELTGRRVFPQKRGRRTQ